MCSATKMRIATALKELMQERPLRKITVQDIMDRTKMKRQSFYYHFQDVYDVLEWEINRTLFEPLQYDPDQTYEDWCMAVLEKLDQDRSFYRKALTAIGPQISMKRCEVIARPQMCRLLLEEPYPEPGSLTDEEEYVIDFFNRAFCNELMQRVMGHEAVDRARSRRRIQMLCNMVPQNTRVAMPLYNKK